jgi:hypothetical protein
MICVVRLHRLAGLRRLSLPGARSEKLRRRNLPHGIRALADSSVQISANLSRAWVPHRDPIRSFGGYSPIEVNVVALAYYPKISNRLGKIQRWRLRDAGNAAAHKGSGTKQQ